jgi:lipoprotein-anchoring transpeptidase ErfK/SrfK
VTVRSSVVRRRLPAALVLLAVVAVTAVGCSFDSPKLPPGPPVTTGPPQEATTTLPGQTTIATTTVPATGSAAGGIAAPAGDTCTATTDPAAGLLTSVVTAAAGRTSIPIYESETGTTPCYSLPNPSTDFHQPDVFMVISRHADRDEVQLPVRPNLALGWVNVSDVTLAVTNYRISVSLSGHRVQLFQGQNKLIDTPAGVGTGDTPTPPGTYYTVALIKPTNSGYGPYAYALSGHSDKLQSFAGGDGRLGLHGTDDPSSIGKNVSHGCIRIPNDIITKMVQLGLPLGVPVTVTA